MITNTYRKKNYQYFKCYNCLQYFKITKENDKQTTQALPSNQYKCIKCFSLFIEEISENEFLSKQLIQIPLYDYTKQQKNNEIQVIKKKVKFKNTDPFVRDVLKPQFPTIFNKKKNDILAQFQSTVSRINIFELDLNKNGPTDPSFIKKLKRIKFTNLKEVNKTCSICTDNFIQRSKVIQLPCRHVFHKYCIIPWLELNNSCPVCRFEFPAKSIIQLQHIRYYNVRQIGRDKR